MCKLKKAKPLIFYQSVQARHRAVQTILYQNPTMSHQHQEHKHLGPFLCRADKRLLYILMQTTNSHFDLRHKAKHADLILADVGYRCKIKAYAQQLRLRAARRAQHEAPVVRNRILWR
jgi:hypothetical protein